MVCPSLPGHGFSDKPAWPGWGIERIAAAWTTLMERLGYQRYGAQGGDGQLEHVLTRDELLDNLMLYWLPGTGASAARLYWESTRQVSQWISGTAHDTVTIPTGCSIFPRELQRPSRGGHFAAFEQPEAFVREVRSFFRLVR